MKYLCSISLCFSSLHWANRSINIHSRNLLVWHCALMGFLSGKPLDLEMELHICLQHSPTSSWSCKTGPINTWLCQSPSYQSTQWKQSVSSESYVCVEGCACVCRGGTRDVCVRVMCVSTGVCKNVRGWGRSVCVWHVMFARISICILPHMIWVLERISYAADGTHTHSRTQIHTVCVQTMKFMEIAERTRRICYKFALFNMKKKRKQKKKKKAKKL